MRAPVPTNAQLRLRFQDERGAEVLELVDGTSSIVASGVVDPADFEVLVREDAGGAAVPTRLHRSAGIERPSFIVQPTQPLAPKTVTNAETVEIENYNGRVTKLVRNGKEAMLPERIRTVPSGRSAPRSRSCSSRVSGWS